MGKLKFIYKNYLRSLLVSTRASALIQVYLTQNNQSALLVEVLSSPKEEIFAEMQIPSGIYRIKIYVL